MFNFQIISKLNFLQNITSVFINFFDGSIIHNIEKYYFLKKICELSCIEKIQGDYLEFGVYTGSSFSHVIRTIRAIENRNKKKENICFYGFDSFEGFGKLTKDETHPFYKDINFKTDYNKVNKRIKKIASKYNYKLIKGFFFRNFKLFTRLLWYQKS